MTDKYIFLSEQFHLAEVCFSFFFERSQLKKVGAYLTKLQGEYTKNAAPTLNADAYLQVEGARDLDYPYNIYDFGRLGKIDSVVAGLHIIIVHLDHTLYQLARRGPYRDITKRDAAIVYPQNPYVKGALRRRIPVRFNSLVLESVLFETHARAVVLKIFSKALPVILESRQFQIYHALRHRAEHDFWKSNYLLDPNHVPLRRDGNPFTFYVRKDDYRLSTLVRNPPPDEPLDPYFTSIALGVAYGTLRNRVHSFYDLAVTQQGDFNTIPLAKWSDKKLLNVITSFTKQSRLLERYRHIPLFVEAPDHESTIGFATADGIQLLRWLRADSLNRLRIAKRVHAEVVSVAIRVQAHLSTVATNRLNIILLVVGIIGLFVGLLDAYSNVFAVELKTKFPEWLKLKPWGRFPSHNNT